MRKIQIKMGPKVVANSTPSAPLPILSVIGPFDSVTAVSVENREEGQRINRRTSVRPR
jgi:hypothetical protein